MVNGEIYDHRATIYAVKNRRTGKYVTGTNFNNYRQIMNPAAPPLLISDYGISFSLVETELRRRRINKKSYKITPVEITTLYSNIK